MDLPFYAIASYSQEKTNLPFMKVFYIAENQTKNMAVTESTTTTSDELERQTQLQPLAAPSDDESSLTDPNSRPECFKSTFQEILFVATTTMAISMGSFTIGSNTVITSFIWQDLNMTSAQVTWIGASTSYVFHSPLPPPPPPSLCVTYVWHAIHMTTCPISTTPSH
jgi:hypothetical protein